MVRISPSVIIAVGEGAIQPYAKAGLAFGTMGRLTEIDSYSNGYDNFETTTVSEGGLAIGFCSAAGIKTQGGSLSFFGENEENNKMTFFAEIAMINQTWAPTKSIVTKFTVNKTDQLSTLTLYEKETDFVDSYTEATAPDLNAVRQSTKNYLPMSSFGIYAGVRFTFWK